MTDRTKIRFEVVADDQYPFYGSGVMARVLKNGTAIGAIRFETKEEFEWFQQRTEGEYDEELFLLEKGEE